MFNCIEIKSFVMSISPVYFTSKLLGQVPYRTIKGNRKLLMKYNAVNTAYSLACYGLYFVTLYFSIIESINYKYYENTPNIMIIGLVLHTIIGLTNSVTGLILAFLKANQLSNFLTEIRRLDDEFYDLCETIRIDYKKSFIFQLKCLIVSVMLFCFVGMFDYYYVFQGLYDTMSIVVVISYIIPYMMAACSAGQYIIGVHMINERFILINKFLSNIFETNEPTNNAIKMHRELFEDESDRKSWSITNNKNTKPPYSISLNLIQRKYNEKNNNDMEVNRDNITDANDKRNNDSILNAMEKFNDSVMSTNRKPIEKVRRDGNSNSSQSFLQFFKSAFNCNTSLNKIIEQTQLNYPLNLHLRMNEIFLMHDKLCDIAECFNDLYSIEMLVNITGSFILILFGIFFEIKVIFWTQGLNIQLLTIATSYILWGILVSTIIYVALKVCSNTREESCESALIIHKILQNKPAFMLNDDIFYNKMKSFTLQILNRKKIFHFNVLGLFRMDYTFIFSIISAATSYLIVLLQFDMNEDFQKLISKNTTSNV